LETALLVTNITPRCLKGQHLAASSEAVYSVLIYTRCEVFIALCILIVVCWVVRSCSLILNMNILHEHGGPGQCVSYIDQVTGWMIRGSVPQIMKTSSETHPASYSMVTGVSSPGGAIGCGKNLTAHQHLVLRLRKHGALTLLPLHAFVMKTGTKLPFLTQYGDPSSGSNSEGYTYGRLHQWWARKAHRRGWQDRTCSWL